MSLNVEKFKWCEYFCKAVVYYLARGSDSQCFPTPLLKARCAACLRCFPASADLIYIDGPINMRLLKCNHLNQMC